MGTLIFKDKNGNQGTVEGINATDYATLNDLIEAVNIIGQSSSARNFIDSLAKIDFSNLSTGALSKLVPTAVIFPFAGTNIPNGFLLCNGAAVSRTVYVDLFEVIGTVYGAGDGSTTFNLPDMRNRYPIGAGDNAPGTYVAEQLPNITGNIPNTVGWKGYNSVVYTTLAVGNSSSSYWDTYDDTTSNSHVREIRTTISAARSNTIYTDNGKVYPASIALNFIIKT